MSGARICRAFGPWTAISAVSSGSWRNSETFVPLIRKVTAADLQRVARTYFQAQGRTVGTLLPGAPPASAGR